MNKRQDTSNSELDDRISFAMDKIVQETIGHIAVTKPIPSSNKEEQKLPRNKVLGNKVSGNKKKKQAGKKLQYGVSEQANNIQLAQPKVEKAAVVSVEPKSVEKHSIAKKATLIVLAVVVLACLGTYGGFAYYYHDKFMPGTQINQIDCKEMSAEEAEEQIRKKVEDYAINIQFREDKSQKLTGTDIEYAYVSDGSIAKMLKKQNSLKWIAGYFIKFEYEVPESITFNKDKLQDQFAGLESLQADRQAPPVNAFVNYQNGQFEIVPEVEGTTVDRDILYAALEEVILKSDKEINAEQVGAYKQPQVRQDSEVLAAEQGELNALVNASVTYKLPKGDEVLDGNTLRTWLLVDEQGHFGKDDTVFEERLIEYVAALSERTDTIGTERPFTTTGGREIMVGGGVYGWKVNQNEEIATLRQNLANNEQLEREPIYSSREVTTENNGFGNTYIELDLGEQNLYFYQDGQLVMESEFVSGRMTRARYTPPGIFNLYYKTRDRVLRGSVQPDGTYEYESPVSFWMPFNGGIGFHDASWRWSFGGTIYKYKGSHGCINMPYEKARVMYDLITKDIPIIAFYADGYSLY